MSESLEYSIERHVWVKIVIKNDLYLELLEAFEKRDQRFLFDLVGFCEEHGVKLSESDRKEIKKVEDKFLNESGKCLKLRIVK